MEQIELLTIESPCRGVCENSTKGFCKGCLRSREERFHWFSLSNEGKRKILELCKYRRQRLLRARQERLNSEEFTKVLPYGMEHEEALELTPALDQEVFELISEPFYP